MRSLKQFILEAADGKKKVTVEWMKEKYKEFNEKYFNNELPKNVELSVKNIGISLGVQGEHYKWYASKKYMKNDMYQMMIFPPGTEISYTLGRSGNKQRWVPDISKCTPISSIEEVMPYIKMNERYVYTEKEMEDTLLHEMVHLWTYKDGLSPKMAHGKEFKRKCKEILKIAQEKYGVTYSLETRVSSTDGYEISQEEKDRIQQAAIDKSNSVAGGIWSIYIEFSDEVLNTKTPYAKRFLFCSKNMINRMFYFINHQDDSKYITAIYISPSSYVPCCQISGTFQVMKTYKFWDATQFENLIPILQGNKVNVKDYDYKKAIEVTLNESLIESKEEDANLIEIPSDTNLSEIDVKEIIDGVDDEIEKMKKSDGKEDKTISVP